MTKAFQRNRIYGNEDYIIKVAKSKGIHITYDNFKCYDNEDGWCLNVPSNGKLYLVIVDEEGRIERLDKNLAGRNKRKQHYHPDGCGKKGYYWSWIVMFDSIKTTHNPKSMGKMKNKVDFMLSKNNYIKFT